MFSEAQLRKASRFLDGLPHFAELGLELTAMDRGYCQMRLPYKNSLIGNPVTGVLHGGVVTTLLDSVCGLAVFASFKKMRPVATLDLRIDYLKPASPRVSLYAEARVDKMTRSVAFVSGVAFHDDALAPVARATASFMLDSVGSAPVLSGSPENRR